MGGLIGVAVFQQAREHAADQQGRDGGDRREHVPGRADLAGHRVLPADRRCQSVLGAGDEKERGCQRDHREEKRPIGHRRQGEAEIENRADGAEQQHESAISHVKRIPHVADESEHKGQIERDCRDELEMRDLPRLQVQSVLEKKADGNADQASRRSAEGQKNDQDAEIEKDVPARGSRQIFGRQRDRGGLGGGTVHRHYARSVFLWNAGAASYRLKTRFDRGLLQDQGWSARSADRGRYSGRKARQNSEIDKGWREISFPPSLNRTVTTRGRDQRISL
ncbi:hypothetical protein GALL_524310 [mine drainage metagenome]|uniref:Uncharacterized protein n=1 Tax=mine drainage metagenome TaxID=410659 RepID=A0A1J5PDW1_9ZZZZ